MHRDLSEASPVAGTHVAIVSPRGRMTPFKEIVMGEREDRERREREERERRQRQDRESGGRRQAGGQEDISRPGNPMNRPDPLNEEDEEEER